MQFTLGITGDLLTNEGNPCFGLQPLEAFYKEKKIKNVRWRLSNNFYFKTDKKYLNKILKKYYT